MTVYICSFASTDAIVGGKTYEKVREAVLAAGRFSIFEATESQRMAGWFERLKRDPTLEIFELAYPWIGIRTRA